MPGNAGSNGKVGVQDAPAIGLNECPFEDPRVARGQNEVDVPREADHKELVAQRRVIAFGLEELIQTVMLGHRQRFALAITQDAPDPLLDLMMAQADVKHPPPRVARDKYSFEPALRAWRSASREKSAILYRT